jgi:hypothetical protein
MNIIFSSYFYLCGELALELQVGEFRLEETSATH